MGAIAAATAAASPCSVNMKYACINRLEVLPDQKPDLAR